MKEEFFNLLKRAVGNDTGAHFELERAEWESLYNIAKKHAILGVTFDAIDSLPNEERPSLGIYTRWALAAEKIEDANKLLDADAATLTQLFENWGYRSCILKGQGIARYYPASQRRQCGDIDIWVECPRKEMISRLKESGYPINEIVYHHCSPVIFKKTEVEVHFTPSWMNSPILNRRLQSYFNSLADIQFSHPRDGQPFTTPTTSFAAFYGILHIFRHVFYEGIGLRQLMDIYFVLKFLPVSEQAQVKADLDRFIPKSFTAAVMHILVRVFGAERDILLCGPDSKRGEELLDEILLSGNFGMYNSRNRIKKDDNLFQKACKRMMRISANAGRYPREFFSAPFFKAWQYLWRKTNGYM